MGKQLLIFNYELRNYELRASEYSLQFFRLGCCYVHVLFRGLYDPFLCVACSSVVRFQLTTEYKQRKEVYRTRDSPVTARYLQFRLSMFQ